MVTNSLVSQSCSLIEEVFQKLSLAVMSLNLLFV